MRLSYLATFTIGAIVLVGAAVPSVASAQPTVISAGLTPSASTTVSAKTLLRKLHVTAESHAGTYQRSKFKGWIDADHDGEDTRAEVLKAESTVKVSENRYGTVKTGKWTSPYDGERVSVASKLDIDHLVPLEEAWVSGASRWSSQRREAFANDLGYAADLVAVSAHANRSKGDREPNTYLPAKRSYRCTYIRNYIAVKFRWGLSVDVREKKALAADLTMYCSSVRVRVPGKPDVTNLTGVWSTSPVVSTSPAPVPSSEPVATATPVPDATATDSPSPVQTTPPGSSAPTSSPTPSATPTTSGTDPDYGTCANAKAHHAHTPYYRGIDPEYAYYRDSDGDGVVCE